MGDTNYCKELGGIFIKPYVIISARKFTDVEKVVNFGIEKGYVPQGGVSLSGSGWYTQAMYKYSGESFGNPEFSVETATGPDRTIETITFSIELHHDKDFKYDDQPGFEKTLQKALDKAGTTMMRIYKKRKKEREES